MPVIRNLKVLGSSLVDRTVPAEKLELDTLTSSEIGPDAVGSSKVSPSAIYWGHVRGTVLKYVSVGTVETAIDTGLPSVSAFFINLWDARGVAKTRDPEGGTIYLIADTAGSIDLYAIT